MLRKIVRELGIFVVFLLLAVALTWPLAIRLDTACSDLGDPLLNAWILNWDQHAWTHGSAVYQPPVFYPAKYPLAFSENLFGIAILMMPFYLAGMVPLAVHNLAMILGFAFCGYGASVLARVISRSMAAGFICGTLYAFTQFRLDHLPHLQITWSGWLPLILAALIVYWRDPRPRNAALFGGAVLMNGLTNIHWLLFGTTAAGLTALFLFFIAGRRPLRFWISLGIATVIALAVLVPVLTPYKEVSKLYGMKRVPDEVMDFSADWRDWLFATDRNRTWGVLPDWDKTRPERLLFPGMMPLLLTGVAIVLARRRDIDPSIAVDVAPMRIPRWQLRALDVLIVIALLLAYVGAAAARWMFTIGPVRILSLDSGDVPMVVALLLIMLRFTIVLPHAWSGGRSLREVNAASRFAPEFWISVLWIAIGVVGSFGLKAFLHSALFHHVQAFQSLRVPARWAMIAYTGLIGTSSVGVAALLRERMGRTRWMRGAIIALLAIAAFYDVRPRIVWKHNVAQIDPVYRWLVQSKTTGPILEMPLEDIMIRYRYIGAHAFHHVLTLNGVSGFEPPLHQKIKDLSSSRKIPDELIGVLQANGCKLIIVHEDWLRGQWIPIHAWLRDQLTRGTLVFIRRFDHEVGGDWVFALPKNVPDWPALRETERDGAKRTPDEELAAMLIGQPTYSEGTIGHMDMPVDADTHKLPLKIAGWTLSPYGVQKVDVLFESGRVRVPADIVWRADVSAFYPWYPSVPKPGFEKTFTKLPHGVRTDTDVTVEITDGRGRRVVLPDVILHVR